METPENPINPNNSKSKEKRNRQKASGLSGKVVHLGNLGNNTSLKSGDSTPPLLNIGEVMRHVQAEYEADGGPRVIRANYVSVTGWIAGTNNHDPVPFESSLERDCAYIAMFEPRITLVTAQPYTIIYKDRRGKTRRYTPDFELSYIDGDCIRKAIIEVKPSDVLEKKLDDFRDRFDAMEGLVERNGNAFYVLTEAQIRTPRLPNTQALFSRVYDREINGMEVSAFMRELKPVLPCTLETAIKIRGEDIESQADSQSLVWALLAGFELEADLNEQITFETELSIGGSISKRRLFFDPGEPWE